MNLIKNNIESLLVALVLCVNVFRFFMGVNETTLSLYAIFVMCIIVLFVKYFSSVKYIVHRDGGISTCYILMALILAYSFLSLAWIPSTHAIQTWAKFVVALTIPALCVALPEEKIKKILVIVILINIVYCLVILLQPGRAVNYMLSTGANYLSVTLTIGLCLTMTLIKLIFSLNNDSYIKSSFWLGLSAFFFITLTGFTARGVLIFPPMVAIILTLFNGKKNRGKSVLILFFLVFLGYIAFMFYLKNGGEYSTNRFMQMLENADEENRIPIWITSLNNIIDNNWFIIGGGIEAFKYNSTLHIYPHNIFIQMLGEYGLWGLMTLLGIIFLVIKRAVIFIRSNRDTSKNETFLCVLAGVLYYIFTFSKSFSMYDSCPLFIMLVLCMSITCKTASRKLSKIKNNDSKSSFSNSQSNVERTRELK